MDEESYLERIRSSLGDMEPVREYATWLRENGDPRAAYLIAELELREAETRIRELRSHIHQLASVTGITTDWLDSVIPITVTSPITGTFYATPRPDEPSFVKPGDICTPDTTIGIVEAKKVFYEISAEYHGVVAEVVIPNSQPVASGDTLVKLSRPPRIASGG